MSKLQNLDKLSETLSDMQMFQICPGGRQGTRNLICCLFLLEKPDSESGEAFKHFEDVDS